MIRELIVVEGKNDAHAVRRALGNVDVLWTEGFGLTREKLTYIAEAAKRQGVIVFTDPDTVGEQIRNRIRERVPQAKHVYLSKSEARKSGDIGVEHGSPAEIRRVFAHIQQELGQPVENFTPEDLVSAGLMGAEGSGRFRLEVGRRLGVGDTNAKQFLKRLNRFGISREQFFQAVEEMGVQSAEETGG